MKNDHFGNTNGIFYIKEHHRLIVLFGIDDFKGSDDPGNGNLFLFLCRDSSCLLIRIQIAAVLDRIFGKDLSVYIDRMF